MNATADCDSHPCPKVPMQSPSLSRIKTWDPDPWTEGFHSPRRRTNPGFPLVSGGQDPRWNQPGANEALHSTGKPSAAAATGLPFPEPLDSAWGGTSNWTLHPQPAPLPTTAPERLVTHSISEAKHLDPLPPKMPGITDCRDRGGRATSWFRGAISRSAWGGNIQSDSFRGFGLGGSLLHGAMLRHWPSPLAGLAIHGEGTVGRRPLGTRKHRIRRLIFQQHWRGVVLGGDVDLAFASMGGDFNRRTLASFGSRVTRRTHYPLGSATP